MTTAIILVGHGSHITPQTADVVWQHVDALRAMNIVDEVTAAFWKEAPSLHWVLDTLAADDVTVIPLFTAQGYFTRTVIPNEMGLRGPITRKLIGGSSLLEVTQRERTIRYTRTLSEHPYLGHIVEKRIRDTLASTEFEPERTAVAIIGHSTRQNPESRKATEAQAAQIRALGLVAEVIDIYLDDSPEIAEIYKLTQSPNLIAVPYFLAFGSHATIDVPGELGLQFGETWAQIQGRQVYYTAPVGVESSLRDVLIELAREAGAPLYPTSHAGSAWDSFPVAGRYELIEAVQTSGGMNFGQLWLTPQEVRRAADDNATALLTTPDQLRAWVRTRQNFRPLPTTTDLPGGWYVALRDPSMLYAIVETVYPGAVADWAAQRNKIFAPETFDSTIVRQVGMYHQLVNLTDQQRQGCVAEVCRNCIRTPAWVATELVANTPQPVAKPVPTLPPKEIIPCGEPCNVFLTQALKTFKSENDTNS